MTPDLAAQIACIERELRLRHNVSPRLVQQGKMTPPQAQHDLFTMASVLRTLRALAREPQQEELPYATPGA
jgi:hypothetical protein